MPKIDLQETDLSSEDVPSTIKGRILRKKLTELSLLEEECKRRKKLLDASTFGLLNLMDKDLWETRKGETEKELIERQEDAIYNFCKDNLFLLEDGKRVYVKLIPEARKMVADIFFRRVSRAILWKSRGGGGSVSAASLIFLMMLFQSREFTNLAGSGSQSRSIYEKVRQFCRCNMSIYNNIVQGDALLSRTHFKNGAKLHCINATEKAVRSRHDSGLVVDEGCLLPGSKVITERGIINVEDVVPGDCVVNQNGMLTSVKNVWSKDWDNKVVNISINGWADGLELTHDHRVKIIRGLEKGARNRKSSVSESDAEWVNAKDVIDSDYVLIPKIKTCDIDECIIPDTYSGGKWLGYWLGDGWTKKGRSRGILTVFNSKDDDNIDEYVSLSKDLFDREVCFSNSNAENRKNTDTALFTHKELACFLDKTFGTKSTEKKMPFDFIAGKTDEFIRGVISGLIASDGNVWEGKAKSGGVCKRISIQISSEALAGSIFTCLAKLGVAGSYRERPGKTSVIRGEEFWTKKSWVIDINGKAMSLFAETDNSDRKKKPFNMWVELDNYIAVPVKSVELSDYSGKVWDIEVEDGESFMMMNAVVHNCQEDPKSGKVMRVALQNALSQKDHVILVLSTFHYPKGFFQHYWDNSDNLGFEKYKWDIIDTMEPCTVNVDCKKCYLTEKIEVRDEQGNITDEEYIGCNGRARSTEGYRDRDAVINEKKVNEGTDIWQIEYMCRRPQFENSVYNIDAINDAVYKNITWYKNNEKAVGIDWGYVGQTCIVMTVMSELGVGVLEAGWFTESSQEDIMQYLHYLKGEYGDFTVFADSSDQFNNRMISDSGFRIMPVIFKKWKDFGIRNIQKFLETGRIQFLKNGDGIPELLSQMRLYRQERGKIVKKDDHGPDSLLCAMLNWQYFEMFGGSPNLRRMHKDKLEEYRKGLQDNPGSIGKKQKSDSSDVVIFG